jgi:hypothetical protein
MQQLAQPANLDAQARAVRLIDVFCAECFGQKCGAGRAAG